MLPVSLGPVGSSGKHWELEPVLGHGELDISADTRATVQDLGECCQHLGDEIWTERQQQHQVGLIFLTAWNDYASLTEGDWTFLPAFTPHPYGMTELLLSVAFHFSIDEQTVRHWCLWKPHVMSLFAFDSFECMQDLDGVAVQAIQHVWNVTDGNKCEIHGLVPGTTYR